MVLHKYSFTLAYRKSVFIPFNHITRNRIYIAELNREYTYNLAPSTIYHETFILVYVTHAPDYITERIDRIGIPK